MTTEEKRDYSTVPEAIGCSNDEDPIIQVRNIRKWYQVNKGLPIIGSHDWLKAVDDVSLMLFCCAFLDFLKCSLLKPSLKIQRMNNVKRSIAKICQTCSNDIWAFRHLLLGTWPVGHSDICCWTLGHSDVAARRRLVDC